MNDVFDLDATGIAELVRAKEISAREVVDEAISRVERLDPKVNAVPIRLFDAARESAKSTALDGPLAGVPYLVKDLLSPVAGAPLTAGCALLADNIAPFDSVVIDRLRRAGVVIIGKTNTAEFGFLPTTESKFFGPCKNPWDLTRSPGGSSGGSAAAVSLRMVPAAHANDAGGSIRIPAACCGLFGLKPTRARSTFGPLIGDVTSGMLVEHAITRSVRDSALLLDLIAGPSDGDPYVAPAPARPYREEVDAEPGRLKIAFSTESWLGGKMDPSCVAAVEDAAKLCTELGHEVVQAAPPLDPESLMQALRVVMGAAAAYTIDVAASLTGRPVAENVESFSRSLAEIGRRHSSGDYLLAIFQLQRVTRFMAMFHREYAVWLTPTITEPPPPLGTFEMNESGVESVLDRLVRFAPFTRLCNFSGQPGMSVPLYWNEENLPIGVHFTGRYGDEATLFRLAGQLERARPWARAKPPAC